jgi:dihydrofolate reductase
MVGGANVARRYLEAGLLDEFQVQVVPILLGDGVRLFEGIGQVTPKPTRVIEDPTVTHLSYSVVA